MNSGTKGSQNKTLEQAYQQRLESILDNIVDGLVTIDEKGIIQSFNKACERIFGYTAPEVIGQNVSMLMPDPYSIQHDQYLHNYQTTGRAKIIGIGRELVAKKKDGSIFPIDLSVAEVKVGAGRLYSGIIRDITQRKESEKFASLLSAIIESSSDAIISKTLEGIITSWNAGAERLFGYTAEEVIGKYIGIIIPSERMAEENRILSQIREGRRVESFETVRLHKDGRNVHISVAVSPVIDASGAIIGASKVARDMTERREQETQLRHAQKMEAVGQLTSGVAHDFNNLLTVVLGNTRLIRKHMKTDDKKSAYADINERVDDIDIAAQRGADLVRRLMVFTRQRSLQKATINPRQFISEAEGLLTRALNDSIELKLILAENLTPVSIDPDQFINALINLTVNARDAMSKGGKLTIEAENSQHDSNAGITVSVSDTGEGMPPEIKERIFEPFFTTKPSGEGTGLGLSMVYGFVQQSEGAIEVESVIGKGTTFRIFLPAAKDEVKS